VTLTFDLAFRWAKP